MNKEELKNKCTERAKIFQQAMESCHSSSPIDCIEWFADRIAELEAENERLTVSYETLKLHDEEEIGMLKSENAELKTDYEVLSCSVGDFGELQDKLEEEQRKNNGLSDNLTKAKGIIQSFVWWHTGEDRGSIDSNDLVKRAKQFLNEVDK